LTDDLANATTRDWVRQATRTLFDTYPLLAGIGVTAGKITWLMARNVDMYYLRWGDPDFARSYLTKLPDSSKIAGFCMGPDGHCWGREFVSTEPESPCQQVMDKINGLDGFRRSLLGRTGRQPHHHRPAK
jgi:hypothetical protein